MFECHAIFRLFFSASENVKNVTEENCRTPSVSACSVPSFSSPLPTHHRSLQTATHSLHQDPHSLLKQDPIEICTSLWVKTFSSPKTTSFPNLTGFLSNFDLWRLAYQRSCAHATGTFPPRNAVHTNVLKTFSTFVTPLFAAVSFRTTRPTPSFAPPTTPPFRSLSPNANFVPFSIPSGRSGGSLDGPRTGFRGPVLPQVAHVSTRSKRPHCGSNHSEQLRGLPVVSERGFGRNF
ncbi:hypothetical protein RJT34_14021 [Clitoria ternatea]|uniref:Uncharacterized protein n=1 Tax=Clitoria ternatea TaxID=43366 RepID=A0AAN9JPL9_CLITE